jgi:hypothetical protein
MHQAKLILDTVTSRRYLGLLLIGFLSLPVGVISGGAHKQTPAPTKGHKSMDNAVRDVTLSCQPELLPGKLKINYTVSVSKSTNSDVYVLDVLPTANLETRQPLADLAVVYLSWKAPATAHILKGIPPLPVGRRVLVRRMPLGTKIAPGGKLERTFELPLPLIEQGPYDPPLKRESYDGVEVNELLLTVQFVRSTLEGFNAQPVAHGPDLYYVRARFLVDRAESLNCDFHFGPIELLRRKEGFTRV